MTARLSPEQQLTQLKRGCVEVISEAELKEKLAKKPQLIIKAGFDPTAPDLHLGHTVLLRKLRRFQDLGHTVIFLIGDATALVGDPSGQSKIRKLMTPEEVHANAVTYYQQVQKILKVDSNVYRPRYNSEWFGGEYGGGKKTPFGLKELVELTSKYTVARLIERDDFQQRLKVGEDVSMLELFYPLMQGYDSVQLESDVEIGGTDQKFNLLVGRDLQRRYGQEPQVVMTLPLLVGLDGVNKMSKSLGNHIGINEKPEEMFGKLMSISDAMMWDYFTLLTDEDVTAMKRLHPMEAKKRLARTIVETYHPGAGPRAQEHFERTVQRDETPADVPSVTYHAAAANDRQLLAVVSADIVGLAKSRSAARRMIEQGGVKVNGQVIRETSHQLDVEREYVVQFGKRGFRRVRLVSADRK